MSKPEASTERSGPDTADSASLVRDTEIWGGPGPTLGQVLQAVDEAYLQALATPHGLDVELRQVVILDPDDEPDTGPGDLVLLIGARGREITSMLLSAGQRGTTAMVAKIAADERLASMREAAMDAGTALLAVPPNMRWEQLELLVRAIVEDARVAAVAEPEGPKGIYSR